MKKVIGLVLVAVLLLTIVGCDLKKENSTPIVAQNEETAEDAEGTSAKQTQSQTVDEASVYTRYLKSGGYEEIMPAIEDNADDQFTASSCLADLDQDGTKELFIELRTNAVSGPGGYYSEYVLLDIIDGSVITTARATYGAGSQGGVSMYIVRDSETNADALMISETYRVGAFSTHVRNTYWDPRSIVKSITVTEDEVEEMDCAYSLLTECSVLNLMPGTYCDEEIAEKKQETDKYSVNENYYSFYEQGDQYITEQEYDAVNDRFQALETGAYKMWDMTLDNPIHQ